MTFPTVGASGATINGFYITNNGHTICIGQANFDDVTAVVLVDERHHQGHADVRVPALMRRLPLFVLAVAAFFVLGVAAAAYVSGNASYEAARSGVLTASNQSGASTSV